MRPRDMGARAMRFFRMRGPRGVGESSFGHGDAISEGLGSEGGLKKEERIGIWMRTIFGIWAVLPFGIITSLVSTYRQYALCLTRIVR